MKKILISLGIIGVVAAAAVWGTSALFTSEQTSTGNTFSTGGVDLRIDSVAHYNGMVCAKPAGDVYQWVPKEFITLGGEDNQPIVGAGYDAVAWNAAHPLAFPKAGDACEGTWPISLATEQPTIGKFINLLDVKPGDEGENTVSMRVYTNDVWACVSMANLHDDDNGLTPPEILAGDTTDGDDNGELAENMYFFAWKDDGDNVYEADEAPLTLNPIKGSDITAGTWALADSTNGGLPLAGDITHYVGLAWCAGEMTVADHTISCSNQTMGNEAQTDSFMADIKFTVVQARNNEGFVCGQQGGPEEPETGTLIVEKIISDGTKTYTDFSFSVNGEPATQFEGDGQNDLTVAAGTYTVTEPAVAGYTTTYGNCSGVEVSNGETKTCTITNTFSCFDQADVMLVLDRSGSINSTELSQLKTAALAFVTALNPDGGVHMGQTSFSTTGTLDVQLTNIAATINAAINALTSNGYTNLFSGLDLANTELDTGTNERPATPDYMIVITDGNPNEPGSDLNARTVAFNEATAAKAAGVTIYVVGVGSDVNATYLRTIASGDDHYYGIANYSDLQAVLNAIANCQ